MSNSFALLLPVKGWDRAKTRLSPLAPGLPRELAAAFARDAIAAALQSPVVSRVYVVTDQADFAVPGIAVLPDEGAGDLNTALRSAAIRIQAEQPGMGVAAMCADVPCLRAEDLTSALEGPAAAGRWFVADSAGTGTTLLAAGPGIALDPHFGVGSASRHQASGAAPVAADLPTLRLDVDTTSDLTRAQTLGVGSHTAEVLRRFASGTAR
jgi:2-phospho-L-lactate guanylyltransferase